MAEHITFGMRAVDFTAGVVDAGFSVEQGFFFATYFLAGIAAASVGAWGLAALSFALSIAPARAFITEAGKAGNNFKHATRRGGHGH